MGNKLLGSTAGLTVVSDAGLAQVTSSWTSGIMAPNIKGCWLASTDASDLVGEELVTNGGFDTDTSGWITTGSATLSIVDQRLRLTTNSTYEQARTTITGLTPGESYIFTVDFQSTSSSTYAEISGIGGTSTGLGTAERTRSVTFTATSSSHILTLISPVAQVADFDNVSVRLADPDRSVNGKGLVVHGTIARTPVAPGAELMGYSGFSATNYLEQPYNPDLDFGTGDFCVMGWTNATPGPGYILDRRDPSNSTGRLSFYRSSGGMLRATIAASPEMNFGVDLDGNWHQLCLMRKDGAVSLYFDGILTKSFANTDTLTSPTALLRVGGATVGGFPTQGALALLRIGATAPTPEQIAKIYRDEKKLFQPGAACTLWGTSDAVSALAHSDIDGLTRVGTSGTSGGLSRFDGLLRVSHDDTPITTTIAAGAGYEVTQ